MNILKDHICTCKECRLNSIESNPTGNGKETIFRILNNDRKVVDKYIVDDCLLKKYYRSEKCDFLFKIEETNTIFLVECKGSDVLKAVNQIGSSLKILESSLSQFEIKGRIICTKVYSPALRTQEYSRLREKLKGDLQVRSIILIETV